MVSKIKILTGISVILVIVITSLYFQNFRFPSLLVDRVKNITPEIHAIKGVLVDISPEGEFIISHEAWFEPTKDEYGRMKTTEKHIIYVLNLRNDKILFNFSSFRNGKFCNERDFIVFSRKEINFLNISGNLYWKKRFNETIYGIYPAPSCKYIGVKTSKGFYIFDKRGNQIWKLNMSPQAIYFDEKYVGITATSKIFLYGISGDLIWSKKPNIRFPYCIEIDKNNKYIAVGDASASFNPTTGESRGGNISLYTLDGKLLKEYETEGMVTKLKFINFRNHSYLLAVIEQSRVISFDIKKWGIIKKIFSTPGNYIYLIDMVKKDVVRKYPINSQLECLGIIKNSGNFIAITEKGLIKFNIHSDVPLEIYKINDGKVDTCAITSDGRYAAFSVKDKVYIFQDLK